MPTLREIIFRHSECGRLFEQAERLAKALFELKDGRMMIPFFTDHGPAHCQKVEEILDTVLFPPTLDPSDPRAFCPNPEEAMYLLAAAWLHDIGMIYGIFPNETEVLEGKDVPWEKNREEHELRSARFIRTNWHIACDWKDPEKLQLGEICVYHRHRYPLSDIVPVVRGRTGEPIRMRDLAALLRLADACHVDASRAPADMKNLFRSFGMPVPAKEHWGLSSLVYDVRFDHDTKKIHAHSYIPEPKQYGTATVDFEPVVKRLAQAIERELGTVIPYLSAYRNTDFKWVEAKIATLKGTGDPEDFLRKTWPCMFSTTTSASEAACLVAAVLRSIMREVADVPYKGVTKVLAEVRRLFPYNVLARRLVAEMGTFLREDPNLDSTGRLGQLAVAHKYLDGFLEARLKAGSRVAVAAHRLLNSDDTLVIYGYSSVVMHLLRDHLRGHRGRVLLVKCHHPGHLLAVQEEDDRMIRRLRDSGLAFREVEMSSLRQILSHFQGQNVKAKVLLGAWAVLNGAEVLARMGSAMIASTAKDCNVPVLVLAEAEKHAANGAMAAEMEGLLAEQATALISPKGDVATDPTDDRHGEVFAPIDRLSREMYDQLVGDDEEIVKTEDSGGATARFTPGQR